MPVTGWSADFFKGVAYFDENDNLKSLNIEQPLNNNDSIEKNKYLIMKLSVTGFTPTDKKGGYYKLSCTFSTTAYDNEQGNYVVIRPKTRVYSVSNGNYYLLNTYDPKVNGSGFDLMNYPSAFPKNGGTDEYLVIFGPFTENDLFGYDVYSVGGVVEVYQADESGPGPTPTSEKGGEE